jgi:hypothetical protein
VRVRTSWLVVAVVVLALLAVGGVVHLACLCKGRDWLRGESAFLQETIARGRAVEEDRARHEADLERVEAVHHELNELLRDLPREHPCFEEHLSDHDVRLPPPRESD